MSVKKLALLLGSVALTLAVGEALLRVAWHNPYRNEDLDHVLKIRRLHARTDHRIDRSMIDREHPLVRFRTNDRAYVIPAAQFSRADASVAFLGGSTTKCIAVREELRFHALVSELLADRGIRVNTLNAGKSGNTVHDSLNVLLNHVVRDDPDVVVLMHATNDAGVLKRAGSYAPRMGSPVSAFQLAKWVVQAASTKLALAGRLRSAVTTGGRMHVTEDREELTLGDRRREQAERFRARLRAFVHLARDLGMRPVLMTQPLSTSTNELTPDWADPGAQDLFNALVREVARREGALLIDLVREIQARHPDWDEPGHLFYDGMHVTDEGSRAYAEIIAESLGGILAEASGAKPSAAGTRPTSGREPILLW